MQIELSDKLLNSSFPSLCFISSFFAAFLTPFMLLIEGIGTIGLMIMLPNPLIALAIMGAGLLLSLLLRTIFRALARKTSLYIHFQSHPDQRNALVKRLIGHGETFSMETKEMKKILRVS